MVGDWTLDEAVVRVLPAALLSPALGDVGGARLNAVPCAGRTPAACPAGPSVEGTPAVVALADTLRAMGGAARGVAPADGAEGPRAASEGRAGATDGVGGAKVARPDVDEDDERRAEEAGRVGAPVWEEEAAEADEGGRDWQPAGERPSDVVGRSALGARHSSAGSVSSVSDSPDGRPGPGWAGRTRRVAARR